MSKCVRCGKSFLTRGKIKLADAEICFKCYDELGFDHKVGIYGGDPHKWEEIKDGRDVMYARENAKKNAQEAANLGLTPKLYEQIKSFEMTNLEVKVLRAICSTLSDEDRDIDVLDVALGDNGSVILLIDDVVIIEYKLDEGVKWIRLLNESDEKIRITGAAVINKMADRIVAAYDAGIV